MDKIDLKKEFKAFYIPSPKNPVIVDVPEFKFLMLSGENALPDNPVFPGSIQLLFGLSYKMKFNSKKNKKRDYTVMPLEGLWWADDMEEYIRGNKEKWKWTLMIMQPDFITRKDLEDAMAEVSKKTPSDLLQHVKLEIFREGTACQVMHIGPYSEEHDNIMNMHAFIRENKGTFDGQVEKHHEIYLSDFRKTAPEKLKTVLRQPFRLMNKI